MDTDQDQADRRVRTICLLILTVIGLGFALALLRPVLVPFCLALLLTYCLTPVLNFQIKFLRLPPPAAVVGAGVAGLLILLVLGYLTAASLGQVGANIDGYHERLSRLTEQAIRPLARLGIRVDTQSGRIFTVTESAGRQLLTAFLAAMTDLISTGALVVIFMIFLLLGRRGSPHPQTSLLGEIEARVRRYVIRLVGLSALTGLVVGVWLAALGIEFAVLFGFLTFLLNFIPNVGAIIATLLPVPVILLSPQLSVPEQVLAVAGPSAPPICHRECDPASFFRWGAGPAPGDGTHGLDLLRDDMGNDRSVPGHAPHRRDPHRPRAHSRHPVAGCPDGG